jgi:hypothetical protein
MRSMVSVASGTRCLAGVNLGLAIRLRALPRLRRGYACGSGAVLQEGRAELGLLRGTVGRMGTELVISAP